MKSNPLIPLRGRPLLSVSPPAHPQIGNASPIPALLGHAKRLSQELKRIKCNTSQLLLRAYCVLGPPPISLHFPLARQEGVEFFFLIISFTYLWLCWVFVAMWALSNCSELAYSPAASFSFRWPPLLQLPRSVHNSCAWLRCPTACGIFPDQGWNLCLLHWQADSLPLRHQGSPGMFFWKRD